MKLLGKVIDQSSHSRRDIPPAVPRVPRKVSGVQRDDFARPFD